MSGIVALVDRGGDGVVPETFRAMHGTDHRGPDGSGTWRDPEAESVPGDLVYADNRLAGIRCHRRAVRRWVGNAWADTITVV